MRDKGHNDDMQRLDASAVRFGADGLVPAIAQQWDTREVLMLAWMDDEAVALNRSLAVFLGFG